MSSTSDFIVVDAETGEVLPSSWACRAGVRIIFPGHGHGLTIKPKGKTGIDCVAPARNPLAPRGVPKKGQP